MRFGRIADAITRGLTFWRRSIQARVVMSTMLLSALVVTVVGWFLLQQTRDGLVDARVDRVLAEAANETEDARARLAAVPGANDEASLQLRQLIEPIIARGASRGFEVVVNGPLGDEPTVLVASGPRYSPGLDLDSVPDELIDQLDEGESSAWTFTEVSYLAESGRESIAGVVVGARIQLPADGRYYTIYYLYPMQQEQETLALVSRALLTAGAFLLVLVGAMTWLVARQVVNPVRMARRTAERLASGHLEERMRVHGDDDIARLATSFNQMASSLQRQIRQLEELSRVQRRFTSDVSHELRTPLTTVRMAGDVLHDARAEFDPVTARAAELLQTELDRSEGLPSALLDRKSVV